MCYDKARTVRLNDILAYFPGIEVHDSLNDDTAWPSDHILAHGYPAGPIVYRTKEGQLLCRSMEWGVIPYYAKDEKTRANMLNARAERILDDPKSYWSKIKNKRCLIPVTGIYEHRGVAGWKKKVPYLVCLKDQPVFFLPGLYSVVERPDLSTGELIRRYTYTLITREANPLLRNIHNDGPHRGRMPLFLSRELEHAWVQQDLPEPEYRSILAYEMPETNMDYHPVFTIRGKPRPDGLDKTAPWTWDKLPPLGEANPPEIEKA